MSQPPTYSRAYNFSDYQATNPSTPVPGNKLDDEFSRIKAVLDAIRANLALIQRDDTAVANESIGYDQLKAELDGFGFNPPSEWATATNYVVRDTVFHDSSFYRCLVSHTSGTFATDLAADKWALIADFTSATSDAEAAKAAAEAAQAAAETAASNAATSETNAGNSATAAAGSASSASDSADAAAASAITAAMLIGGTVTEAVRHDIAQGLDNTQKAQARSNIGIDAVPDDGLVVVDPADATKKARLDAGGVTAGQTRVLAVPDYDGVIAAESKATAIASASTVDLATATGSLVHITGTTTITAFGTVAAGREFTLVFDGALTLTHNGTSLILPGAANITTAAGDTAIMVSEGSGNWRCLAYQQASGLPILASSVRGTSASLSGLSSKDFTIPSWANVIQIGYSGVSHNGAGNRSFSVAIGDAGGVETTGYLASVYAEGAAVALVTSAFFLTDVTGSSSVVNGTLTLTRITDDGTTWSANGLAGFSNAAGLNHQAGSKALSQALTTVRFQVSGDAFDAGTVNVVYW